MKERLFSGVPLPTLPLMLLLGLVDAVFACSSEWNHVSCELRLLRSDCRKYNKIRF